MKQACLQAGKARPAQRIEEGQCCICRTPDQRRPQESRLQCMHCIAAALHTSKL